MNNPFSRAHQLSILSAFTFVMSGAVNGQDDVVAPAQEQASTGRVYTPVDFARFAPRNALDMLNRVPGFAIRGGDQGRGLGQASTNVLINGQRLSRKSQDIFDQSSRVTADNVERIEIVDGSALELPGLSGQVA